MDGTTYLPWSKVADILSGSERMRTLAERATCALREVWRDPLSQPAA